MPEIWFPHLNIEIEHLDKIAFSFFGIDVAWYGIFIATAFLAGVSLAIHLNNYLNKSREVKIDSDLYYDVLIYIMIFSIIGARLYYVAFDFDSYRNNLGDVFKIWNGGLAIYGGIIGGVIAVTLFVKQKKLNFFDFGEVLLPALALGQAIGRWGNFVNREAYGRYTDNIFAMRILKDQAQVVTQELADKMVVVNGYEYIQVHPTFLYESVFNLINCFVLIHVVKNKKFKGQAVLVYMIFYGIIRTITEGLRVDQLQTANGWAVSRVLSMLLVVVGIVLYVYKIQSLNKNNTEVKENE